jgi:hypothetical protein
MEASLTYQQLLAEQYEENAKNLLVHPNEYEDDDQVEEHAQHSYEDQEVERPEDFQKFPGNRGNEETIPKASKYEDKSKTSIRYEKDIKINSFNIDSRFRDYAVVTNNSNNVLLKLFPPNGLTIATSSLTPADTYKTSIASNFIFTLPRTIKNVYSVALTSIELPNTFYEFDNALYNNTTLILTTSAFPDGLSIQIPDGNYDSFSNLAAAVQAVVRGADSSLANFQVVYNKISGKFFFASDITFSVTFPHSIHPSANGLGYFLGFVQNSYTNSLALSGVLGSSQATSHLNLKLLGAASTPNPSITTSWYIQEAESTPVIIANNYIYLALNDWDVVTHRDFNNAHFSAFAKIMTRPSKFTTVYETDTSNTTIKEVFFQQPKDVNKIAITLYDAYGNILNLQGADFSFTLELKEIINMNLYDNLRT